MRRQRLYEIRCKARLMQTQLRLRISERALNRSGMKHETLSGKYTMKPHQLLLVVPSLLALSACSKTPVIVQMPLPPANLAKECPELPAIPVPLVDPQRAQWEADVMYTYAECASKHWHTIDAWQRAIQTTGK